jgi:hypothetical protein
MIGGAGTGPDVLPGAIKVDSVISAIPEPDVKLPERIVGAEAYTLPSDMPTGATCTVTPLIVTVTVSDELMV